MRNTLFSLFLLGLLTFLCSLPVAAEGTREFMPNAGDWTVMQIWDNGDPNRNTVGQPHQKKLFRVTHLLPVT